MATDRVENITPMYVFMITVIACSACIMAIQALVYVAKSLLVHRTLKDALRVCLVFLLTLLIGYAARIILHSALLYDDTLFMIVIYFTVIQPSTAWVGKYIENRFFT